MSPYRVCLILATVQLMTVIKDVFIGGVETRFHAVLDDLTGSGRRLELLDLNTQIMTFQSNFYIHLEKKYKSNIAGSHSDAYSGN